MRASHWAAKASGTDSFKTAEGNTDGHVMRVPFRPGVVKDPGMYGCSLRGNWEISSSTLRMIGRPHREGEEP